MGALIAFVGFVALSFVVIWLVCGPKRSDGAQEQVQPSRERTDPKNAGKHGRGSAPTDNRETHAQSPIDGNERTHEKIKKCRECWAMGIEIGAFVGLCAYAYVTYEMWVEMKTQTVEANRAWMHSLTPIFDQEPELGKNVRIRFPHVNVGHGPAIHAQKSVVIDVVETPIVGDDINHVDIGKLPRIGDSFCATNPPNTTFGVVFPGSESSAGFWLENTTEYKITWTEDLKSGTKMLRARACISYVTFGKPHYTWSCRVFHPAVKVKEGDQTRLAGFGCPDGDGAN